MNLNWKKGDGLLPAIIQDVNTNQVLMLGFMNEDALRLTRETKLVHFYSRTKGRIWKKGETSKNFLHVVDIGTDCDEDTLLILARPEGPTCHLNRSSCFPLAPQSSLSFLQSLEKLIDQRFDERPPNSYTTRLFASGDKRIAQKVGEEALETALATSGEETISESADLIYHLFVLLKMRNVRMSDVVSELEKRHSLNKS